MSSPEDKIGVGKAPGQSGLTIRMSGVFLVIVGGIMAFAFSAPFWRRRGSSIWDSSSQSPEALKTLLICICIGLVLAVIGVVMANWYKQTVPTYRAQRPAEDTPRDDG